MTRQKVIVDGYNVIHAVPALAARLNQDLGSARVALLQRLCAYVSKRHLELVVVFDGAEVHPVEERAAPPGVRVLFSRPPQTADSLIEHLLLSEAHPRSVTLVSGDRHLVGVARERGATVLSPAQFFKRMDNRPRGEDFADQKFGRELTEEEMAEWLALFGEKTPRPLRP
ncbi:MAG: NYN domain-containing protein [bacterium]|jgi:predicted RNA-binding protein with PIN domain|nr:NYN domain-containing protein [candidate division KSB1 bacterium]MDH7559127.1 NYN domain-containing protein [bacterium]